MSPGREQPRALSRKAIDTYWRDGYVVVDNLFSPEEVEQWRAECSRVWVALERNAADPRVQWRAHGGGEMVADRIDPLLDVSPVFEALTRDKRVVDIVGDLVGNAVDVFKGKVIMKRPGTMGYELHQDYPYYEFLGIPADEFAIVLIPMDVCDGASGAMEVFPGHHFERLPSSEDAPLDIDAAKFDLDNGTLLEVSPGDVAVFHGLVPHRSGPNRSEHSRRSLYFSYVRSGYGNIYARYHEKRPGYNMKPDS